MIAVTILLAALCGQGPDDDILLPHMFHHPTATGIVREVRIGQRVALAQRVESHRWVVMVPATLRQEPLEFLAPGASLPREAAPADLVRVHEKGDVVRIDVDGELFTELHYQDVPRPYYYPLTVPGGACITRRWPMEEGVGEAHDHPHHRSLWFTFGEVNGCDFWSESGKHGTIRTTRIDAFVSGRVCGSVSSRHEWIRRSGEVVCTDDRLLRVYNAGRARIFDFEIAIHASHGALTFGDTKEGMMAIRLAPTLRVEGDVAQGHIVNAAGQRDGATWGQRAAWVDYHGPLGEETWGVAIFDHPENLRHPTWWHVRKYGLFAANPFGLRYFEKAAPGAGNHTVAAGRTLTFRYRFYLHPGDEKRARVAEVASSYASPR